MRQRVLTFLTGLAVLFCISQVGFPQDPRGRLSGRTMDATGAVIPGVTVTVTNVRTGVQLTTVTNEAGQYRIDFLDPGTYEVAAILPGFKTTILTVELRISERLQNDLTLELGEVADRITVTADTPLLQTTTADRGFVVDNLRVSELPMSQGNPTFLMGLAAGANPGTSDNTFKFQEPAFAVTGQYSFDGGPTGTTGFTLGGVSNTTTRGTAAESQPPTEAIQEFRISHSYDATHGHHSGTTVDVSLKTGTNDFHGAAYWFIRDTALNANSFLDNRAGNERLDAKYQRIGFAVNGPILRDGTFFASSFEDTRQETVEVKLGTFTIPTPEQLRGDFSKLLALGPQYQIYDPFTTTPTGTGFFERQPIPGNIIPEDRIHPIAKTLSQFWPQPNLPGASDGSSNFQPSTASPQKWWQLFNRVDHTFTPNHRISVHHGIMENWQQEFADDFATLATGFRSTLRRQNFGIDDVYVVNPNLLLNFKYGISRVGREQWHQSHLKDASGGFDITTLGLSQQLIQQLDLSQNSLPHVFIAGYNGIHDATRRNFLGRNVHTALIQADYNRGNHNFKMGFEFRSYYDNFAPLEFTMPSYQFGNDFTRGPLNISPVAPIGQGLAAFLLGQPTGGFIWRRDSLAAHNNSYGIFLQNNWRATSNLTINSGLRYEYYSPVTERFDRSVRGFDFQASSPVEAQARAAYSQNPIPELSPDEFRLRGGYLFAGVGGQPRELYDSPKLLLAPRLGFAYRLTNDSVLRGGYGIFFLPMGLATPLLVPHQAGFSHATNLVPSFDNGVNFVANIADPFPNGIIEPPKSTDGLATDMGSAVRFFNTDGLKAPYMQRWSLTLQQLLPNNTLLEVGYVGSRGTKLMALYGLNFLPQQYLSTKPVRDEDAVRFLSQSIPNPFRGLIPGTALNGNFISRAQLLQPFPHFLSVLQPVNQGYSWYHSLETTVEKRFAHGHMYTLSYTWSKNMEATDFLNPGDPLPHEVISSIDRTHSLSLSTIWELPFGREKRFGNGVSSGLSHIISGWKLSTMWQAMSGFPLGFGNVFFDGDVKDIALPKNQRTVDQWFNTEAGFERNAGKQPAFNLRTFPLRLSSVRTDGVNLWDLSVLKDTRVGEEARIQFRAEFLNAFNNVNFRAVVTNPASGSFGRVTNESTWPRQIQFGLRFIF